MSYARLSEHSDVYIYPDVSGGVTCCFCRLAKAESPRFLTLESTLAHCDEHEDDDDRCGRSWIELKAEIEACPDVIWAEGGTR